jgi:MFS family permease
MTTLPLILVSLLLFGCHFAKSMLPIFAVYLIESHIWSPSSYALLLSVLYFASAALPLFIGDSIDRRNLDNRKLLVGLLMSTVVGQGLFAFSLHAESYALSVCAEGLFGLAASSLVVAQRTIITTQFRGRHAFALGCTMSAANVAKILGKATTAPLSVGNIR